MEDYEFACHVNDVADGQMRLAELSDRLVIIVHHEGQFFCIDDVCTHDGGTLSDGELDGCQLECPRHGARFDVRNGEALSMPATEATQTFEVKVDDGKVFVKID